MEKFFLLLSLLFLSLGPSVSDPFKSLEEVRGDSLHKALPSASRFGQERPSFEIPLDFIALRRESFFRKTLFVEGLFFSHSALLPKKARFSRHSGLSPPLS